MGTDRAIDKTRAAAPESLFDRVMQAVGLVGVPAVLCGAIFWFAVTEIKEVKVAIHEQTRKLDQLIEVVRSKQETWK